ncbi:MAG: response regulator [Candidatus Edwardsbacteria bacterium]|nr:response regulator [Candidatus Edwardsbacteria bacterium]MBU1576783.1 response regulator [Candidatus Edwardsbacteria bacterium]MBU2464578.1 response regulator [Candidatus Edwardsbacteria bacterium]MBU2593360.1 response regulator [Candidatus Edwardsbacteria bacterium]
MSETSPDLKSAPAGGRTILLVEDEVSVREIETQMLISAGYKVLPAGDAFVAERLFMAHWVEIDLLLADMILPGATGLELYKKFKKRKSGLQGIIVSGSLEEDCELSDDILFLQKPYRMTTLIKKVNDIFER